MRWGLLLAAGCAAAPPEVDVEGLRAQFEAVHTPIYDVFAQPLDADAIHDHLAASFVGEALTRQYVQTWRARVRMEAEQTGIDVLGVRYDEVEVADADGGVDVEAAWWVRGVVRHKQHRHPRIHRYRAAYTLVPTPDGLRIASTFLKDLSRVDTRVDALDVFADDDRPVEEDGFLDPLELFEAGLLDVVDEPPAEAP